MNRLWKTLSTILVVCVVGGLMFGCSSNKENNSSAPPASASPSASASAPEASSPAPANEPPLVVNVLLLGETLAPVENNPMHQWLLENKNVDIRFTVSTGEVTDQMNMMLAGGDIPDAVLFITNEINNSIANKWADAGHIVELDSWLAKYPDMLKYNDAAYTDSVYRNANGKMYMIPANPAGIKELIRPVVGYFIKEDWLKQVGKTAPVTTDELFEVLTAFKEQIPDVDGKPIIPATFDHGGRQSLMYTWTQNWYNVSEDNKSLYWWFNHPQIEEYMVFMNKLYTNGLLDRELLTQQPDQYQAKLSSGRVGFTLNTHVPMDIANAALKAIDPGMRYVPTPPIRVPGLPLPVYMESSPNQYNALVVSKKFAGDERNMERLMEFLNWNASREGALLLSNGPEGEYYVPNAEGLFEPKPEVKAEQDKGDRSFDVRTGVGYYNLLRYPVLPKANKDPGTEEMLMAADIWHEGIGESNRVFASAGTGPEWDKHWGNLWPEIAKWEAKAIFAKSEEEARRITKEMLEHFTKIGAPEVTAEKLKLMEEFMNKQ